MAKHQARELPKYHKPVFSFTPKAPKERVYMDSKGTWFTKGDDRHTKIQLSEVRDLTSLLVCVAP